MANDSYSTQSALEFALRLSYPRNVGSEGERRARGEIHNALTASGWDVVEDSFVIEHPVQALERLLFLARMLLIPATLAAALQSPWLSLVGAGLYLLSVFLPFARPIRSWAFRRSLRSGGGRGVETANLVARLTTKRSASTPVSARVVFCAHYDTKDGIPLGARISLYWAALLTGAVWVVASVGYAFASESTGWLIFSTVSSAVLWLLHALLLRTRSGNRSPGAVDNASGVGVLLEIARSVAARNGDRLGGLDVEVLVTSAEELGLLGAVHHARRLESDVPTLVVNFDSPGLEGPLWWVTTNRSGSRSVHLPPGLGGDLEKEIESICRKQKIPRRSLPMLIGAAADHLPFGDAGFPALTVGSFGRGLWWAHTPFDVPANLYREGFERAGRIAEGLLDRLSAGVTP